ncbi:hypothetical protein AN217_01130 [Streptomyces qinglanensis]|uniref:Uncharacterized protein n=1 Tax=Streptomyces qinglanensis TaxID=943816 RepID=A0A1E7KDC2_9ACTN|nr:helicase C-terminal domain-containing protein [Streptomyces qinglanensis]OEV01925.1 hypothetical protein AN217_01130 [Streptomyces qinglanensis]OEV26193.1 hypothetical protein AN220_09425 [Streptomyces nanshensis]
MKSRSTLATWLSSLDGRRLARVLEMRRDATAPPEPRSVGELADRLQRPGAVALALPQLALPHLQVAEALAALPAPASRDALAELLGTADDDTTRELEAVLEALADQALVWPDGGGQLRMAGPLRKAWDAPLGLDTRLEVLLSGATSEELRGMLAKLGIKPPSSKSQRLAALVEHHSDPERILSLVAKAPAAPRKLLEGRAGAGPARPARFIRFGSPGPDPEPGDRWALERGLLIQDRHRYGPARMPAEVALALRGPGWHAPFQPVPPSPDLAPVTPSEVDHEASAAASAFAAGAASVLSACSAAAPTRLKSGGIGARELARIGKAAHADDAVVRLTLETAYAAGLLARDSDCVAPSEAYDTWVEQEPPEQFAVLLRAWRNLPLTPTQARDEDNKALPALAGAPPCDGCVQARHGLLAAAAWLPAGQGVLVASDLGPLIAWHRPLADSSPIGPPFATAIREAELLGVLARGALSAVGVHLRTGDMERLGIECRRLLPSATSTAHLGADLTAVVTGTPSARLTSLLNTVADRETSDTASVWRFSADSVRRALDAGRTPKAITADLAAVAAGPLPQPLSYLIADTARGYGRVRIAPAACVLHGDEPALLAELAAHRRLAELGLRQLAPTVLISRSPLDTTLAALRAEGYAPVAETDEGTVRVERARPRRAAAPVPAPRGSQARDGGRMAVTSTAKESPASDPSALAVQLLAAPATIPEPAPFDGGAPFATDTEEIVAGWAKRLPYSDVRQLAHAIDAGQAITVEYVATSGNRTVRTLSRLDLDPPYLEAWCHLRGAERVFTLSRIHSVTSVAPE